jgi:hypothetical protein
MEGARVMSWRQVALAVLAAAAPCCEGPCGVMTDQHTAAAAGESACSGHVLN